MYGAAKRSFIRLGEGMTRLMRGGEALRAVALLPGAHRRLRPKGRRRAVADRRGLRAQFRRDAQPDRPGRRTRTVNHLRLGDALLNLKDPPIRALFIAANNPAVTNPDAGKVRAGLRAMTCSPWSTTRS